MPEQATIYLIDPTEIEEGKALLKSVVENKNMQLLEYLPATASHAKWFHNTDGVVNRGNVKPRLGEWLKQEGYIHETDKDGFKTFYDPTPKAFRAVEQMHSNDEAPLEPEVEPNLAVHNENIKELAQIFKGENHSKPELLERLLNETDDLTTNEISEIFILGLEAYKTQLEEKLRRDQARLDSIGEKLLCLLS